MTTATSAITTQETLIAGPNQKYWDLGLKCHQEQYSATATMQALYNAWMPPFSLNLLAAIVGALYGDTYWARTKMDRNLLAYNLQAALGMNPSDCQKAANYAFSTWYGLQVRDYLGENSNIPKSGNITNSPDVILNGQTPLSTQQLINLWNVYNWDPAPGLINYAYGRAQSINIQVPIASPVLRMYYSDQGFNPPPSSWVKLYTFGNNSETAPLLGMTPGPIQVGGRAANGGAENEAFQLKVPGSGHYCAISVAGTEFFTNNPSDSGTNWDSYEWLTNNGAAGWHNVNVASGKVETLRFYNQDATAEHFVFEAHATKVPVGTTVSLAFEDRQLANASPTQSAKISNSYQVVTTEAQVPANSSGNLVVGIDKSLPAGASIDCRLLWVLPAGHKNYAQAVTNLGATSSLQKNESVRVQLGNFTFIGR
ncbi:MAG: hypothetical protein ABSC48_01410 [Terracidiphilus sp.]